MGKYNQIYNPNGSINFNSITTLSIPEYNKSNLTSFNNHPSSLSNNTFNNIHNLNLNLNNSYNNQPSNKLNFTQKTTNNMIKQPSFTIINEDKNIPS